MSSIRLPAASCLVAGLLFSAPAWGGSDNTLYILQDSSLGGMGNQLFVDQSNASGSRISGAMDGTSPALQQGFGNVAEVLLTGEAAAVVLLQRNNLGTDGGPNNATLTGGALATIFLEQDGVGNDGSITVTGLGAVGVLRQFGNDNLGAVEVTGDNAYGELVQIGNRNSSGLQVQGEGTSVTYVQQGNDLNSATVPMVYSNGATVQITQTGL